MSNTTTYDVQLVYGLRDQASAGLAGIAGNAEKAAHSTDALSSALGALGTLGVGAMGIHEAEKTFIGLNQQIEDTNLKIATMVRANGLAESFSEAQRSAEDMFEHFKQFAMHSPLTTTEISSFAAGITSAVSQSGGSLEKITNIAERGSLAAKAFGMNAEMAAQQISEALQRGATVREMFTKTLLGTMHMKNDEFNALDQSGRLAVLTRALNSAAMKEAAEASAHSLTGGKSTLEDIWQLTGADAGKALFVQIRAEVESINTWLLQNNKQVNEIRDSVSHGLVEAFRDVKTAVMFLVDHSSEIKLLVEGLLLLKGVGIIGNGISGGVGAISKTLGVFESTTTMASAGLTGVVGAASGVVVGLGLLALGLEALAELIDKAHGQQLEQEGDRNAIYQQLTKSKSEEEARGLAITKAKQFGAINDNGSLNAEKFYAGLFGQGYTTQDPEVGTIMKIVRGAWDDDEAYRRTHFGKAPQQKAPDPVAKKPTTINISISRVEVRSDDPDRFAIGLVELGRRAQARPTQAGDTLRV